MTLHDYCSNSGKDLILDYINSLPEDEKTDGLSVMECMEKGEFDKIRFKRWEKKVYEVYFQKHNRIFYITVDKENIYLLHAGQRTQRKAFPCGKCMLELPMVSELPWMRICFRHILFTT